MQNLLILALIFVLSACSTTLDQEMTDHGPNIERVDIDQDSYKRPEIFVEKFNFSKNSRSIASVTDHSENLSNRQLYFLAYYQQYMNLASILGRKNEIKSCPSFHHIYLEHQEALENSSEQFAGKINLNYVQKNPYLVSQYPVLSLPYSDSDDLFSALKKDNWQGTEEHLKQALTHYYEIEKEELMILCDRGVSAGYYTFENLVQYFQSRSDFHRTHEGLKAVLKIPVVANMLILDNLKSSFYANSKRDNFETWLIDRSNLSWFTEYRENLVKKRKVIVSSAK